MFYKIAVINEEGTVLDTYEDVEPGDAEGRAFGPEILKWIEKTIRAHKPKMNPMEEHHAERCKHIHPALEKFISEEE